MGRHACGTTCRYHSLAHGGREGRPDRAFALQPRRLPNKSSVAYRLVGTTCNGPSIGRSKGDGRRRTISIYRDLIAQARALRDFAGRRLAWVLCLCAVAALVEGAGFALLARLLAMADGVEWRATVDTLPMAAAAIAYVASVAGAAWVVHARTLATMGLRADFADRVRHDAHVAILRMPWRGAARVNSARTVEILTVEATRCGAGVEALLGAATQTLQLLVLLVVAAYLSTEIAILAAVLALLAWPAARAADRRARASGEALGRAHRALAASASDDVAGLRTVKMFGAEVGRGAILADLAERLGSLLAGHAARAGVTRVTGIAASAAAATLLLAYAVFLRGVPTTDALVLAAIAARLFAVMIRWRANWRLALHNAPAYATLRRLAADAPVEPPPPGALRVPLPLRTGIELRALAFAHDGAPIIDGVEALIPAGTLSIVSGPSGAGKSTLADLLAGLLAPSSGEIRIDGVALDAQGRMAWRRRVGYVAQDAFLFDDTLRANLLLAKPDATDADLRAALEAAGAAFALSFAEGLNTRVGERGTRLSTGERARICLAAALLRAPDFLILDETFAPLDPMTAARVAAGLRALLPAATILVIAHRGVPGLAPAAEFYLENGRLTRV